MSRSDCPEIQTWQRVITNTKTKTGPHWERLTNPSTMYVLFFLNNDNTVTSMWFCVLPGKCIMNGTSGKKKKKSCILMLLLKHLDALVTSSHASWNLVTLLSTAKGPLLPCTTFFYVSFWTLKDVYYNIKIGRYL